LEVPLTADNITLCPVCHTSERETVTRTTGYDLVRCTDCGLVEKRYREAGELNLQAKRDEVYSEAALKSRLSNPLFYQIARQRLELLQQVVPDGRLLEIGCATGEFLTTAREAGYEVSGVDSSVRFSEHLREQGIDVDTGDFEQIALPETGFDIVAGFHLLEHIPEPLPFLDKVATLLSPNGLLFLITPNTASRTDQLFAWDHPMFTEADHVCLYSPASVQRLLTAAGFELITMTTREPTHHLFTSLKIFLKQSSSPWRQIVGKFVKPYFLTALLNCWLKRRATRLDNDQAGHEIVSIARKL
jgi:2-polyprenyl-3-methyl-5-hydroxy-6-metoxy-1,4-benzoquinol methylase